MNSRGQGTIEYLVIIAIVVVISLVVVALLLGIFDTNSGQIGAQTQQLDLTTQPLAVKSSLIGTGEDANGLIVISNNTGNLVEDIIVTLNGKEHIFYKTKLSQGDSKTLKLTDLEVVCNPGETKSYQELKVSYYTREGLVQTINYGTVAIDCIADANPTPTKPPTEEKLPTIDILEFRATNPNEAYQRGASMILKNNWGKEITLTKININGIDFNWEKNSNDDRGFIKVVDGNYYPFKFSYHFAPLLKEELSYPSISAKQNTGFIMQYRTADDEALYDASPNDSYTAEITLSYICDGVEIIQSPITKTVTVENEKWSDLYNYYMELLPILDMEIAGGEDGDFEYKGLGFIFRNDFNDKIEVTGLMVNKNSYDTYSVRKMTSYNWHEWDVPIYFNAGETNGLIETHGQSFEDLDSGPIGTSYKIQTLGLTFEHNNLKYHYFWDEDSVPTIITSEGIYKELYNYYLN